MIKVLLHKILVNRVIRRRNFCTSNHKKTSEEDNPPAQPQEAASSCMVEYPVWSSSTSMERVREQRPGVPLPCEDTHV